MFSKSCQNILFSKVYSTLLFRKESISPISGYGPEAILNLITGWYKFAKITSEPNQVIHWELVDVTLGYYSIYANQIELYNNLLFIKEYIALDVIASTGYVFTEKEKNQYSILIELLDFLARKFNNEINASQQANLIVGEKSPQYSTD